MSRAFLFRFGLICSLALMLGACATSPPRNPENICSIFREKPGWYSAALNTQKTWGTPVHVPMSIIYQESSFRAKAQPPRKYMLGFIPWGRVSDAYGYSQALNSTWDQYKRETGHRMARRSNFADSIDFIGWYMHKTNRINGIPMNDAYDNYLSYHEGWTGFQRRSYRNKAWLINVARRVQSRADRYAAQYATCKSTLRTSGWFW